MKRVIFHIDVNNAFLSWWGVYLLSKGYDVDIRTISSAIVNKKDEKNRRGVILAKSELAKKKGIKTADTVYSAFQKDRSLKTFTAKFEVYRYYSNELEKMLLTYSPIIEKYSIDEYFLDMTNTKYLYDNYIDTANQLKEEVKEKLGFSVNVGVANNKICAKMATDLEKPDKVNTIFEEELKTKMWPLNVSKLFMVGRKTYNKLQQMEIETIEDLAKTNILSLNKKMGSLGNLLWEYANGIDTSEVSNREERFSYSSFQTFEGPNSKNDVIYDTIETEIKELQAQLEKNNLIAKTITVVIKDEEFQQKQKQEKIISFTYKSLYKQAADIFKKMNVERVRGVGIRFSNFVSNSVVQMSLFDNEEQATTNRLIANLNKNIGKNTIVKGSTLEGKR